MQAHLDSHLNLAAFPSLFPPGMRYEGSMGYSRVPLLAIRCLYLFPDLPMRTPYVSTLR